MQPTNNLLVVLLVLLVPVQPPWHLDACCPVFRAGADVQIADQKILIAWDPESKIEHFVREAGFRSDHRNNGRDHAGPDHAGPDHAGPDNFGFLVPSPAQPTVEAADGLVFSKLRDATQPQVRYETRWKLTPTIALLAPLLLLESNIESTTRDMAPNAAPSVQVLETKKVAGYDVSVLRADDAGALSAWLATNGYDSRPGLTEWAEPYVAGGWIITAFKYSASQADRVDASAVRISFKTDRPIFPYRVPTDQITQPGRGNLLRTYVVGPGRASGSLSDATDSSLVSDSSLWHQSKLRYSMPLQGSQLHELLEQAIPESAMATLENSWLTVFDDPTWPSSTKDLWFDFDRTATPYREVRVVTTDRAFWLPMDAFAFAAVAITLYVRRRRSR